MRDRNSENKSALLSPVTLGHTAHPLPPPQPASETPPHSLSTSVECSAVPAFGPPLLHFSQVWAGNWQCVTAARGITTQMCVCTSRHCSLHIHHSRPQAPRHHHTARPGLYRPHSLHCGDLSLKQISVNVGTVKTKNNELRKNLQS